MTEWRRTTLGELIAVKHGYAFRGEFFAEEGDELVLTPGNFPIGGGLQFRPGKEKYYVGPYPEEFRLQGGDLLVVMTDLKQSAPILGNPAFVPNGPALLHNQRLGLVQLADEGAVDRRFLYYLLLDDSTRRQLRATATGSTVRHTAPSRICDVRVRMPPVEVQRKIGSALGAIDDLIENNRRRVEVLEEMARAIYREWFVHFRFPGHEDATFVDSDLGPIPEGWSDVRLVDVAKLTMGQSPKSEFYNDDGIGLPFHQGVKDFGRHFPSHVKYCSVENRIVEDEDVLVSVRAPVGRLNTADCRIVIGRGLAAVRSRDDRQALLLGSLQVVFSEEDSMGGGTIFKAITKKELENVQVPRVPDELAATANDRLAEMRSSIRALSYSARRLASMRDMLLPKLVTGQIDVSDLDLDAVVEKASI